MSYIHIMNRFTDVQGMREDLGVTEVAAFWLIASFANLQFWPDEVEVPTMRACERLKISKQRWGEARERLVQADLIEYVAGSRKVRPKYRLILPKYRQNQDLIPDLNPDPIYKERGRTDSREEEGVSAPAAATLGEIISEVEQVLPRRTDVAEIAAILIERHPDRKMSVGRLLAAVKNERNPKFKPATPAQKENQFPELSGWESVYTEEFGEFEGDWLRLVDKYPERALLVIRTIKKERGEGK